MLAATIATHLSGVLGDTRKPVVELGLSGAVLIVQPSNLRAAPKAPFKADGNRRVTLKDLDYS